MRIYPGLEELRKQPMVVYSAKPLTLEQHCSSRSTSAGDQAPVASTTLSARYLVPSLATAPRHVWPSSDKIRLSNAPELRYIISIAFVVYRHPHERTHSPKLNLTPWPASSRPTESIALAAASQPPLSKYMPFQPYTLYSKRSQPNVTLM